MLLMACKSKNNITKTTAITTTQTKTPRTMGTLDSLVAFFDLNTINALGIAEPKPFLSAILAKTSLEIILKVDEKNLDQAKKTFSNNKNITILPLQWDAMKWPNGIDYIYFDVFNMQKLENDMFSKMVYGLAENTKLVVRYNASNKTSIDQMGSSFRVLGWKVIDSKKINGMDLAKLARFR